MTSSPVQAVPNAGTLIQIAILPANSLVKPSSSAFKVLTAANDIKISFSDQKVNTDTYGSGFAAIETKTSAMFSASANGIVAATDDAYKTILVPLGGNTDAAKQNAFVEITCANGDKFEGPVQVSNLNIDLALKEVMRWSCTFTGVGETTYTAAA